PGLLTARRLAIAGAVAALAILLIAIGVRAVAARGNAADTQHVGAVGLVAGTPGVESQQVADSKSAVNPVITWFPARAPERFPISGPIAVEHAGWYRFLVWGEA